jgi:protein-disulfide isomerase
MHHLLAHRAVVAGLLLILTAPLVAAEPGEPAADSDVAVIGKEKIKFDQLPEGLQAELARLKQAQEQRIHQLALDYQRAQQALIEKRTGDFVDSQVLEREARAKQVTVEQLLTTVKHPDVTDADINAFYEQHKGQINAPIESVKPLIAQRLGQQAAENARQRYLGSLRTKYSARVTLAPLREDVTASGPTRGAKDAAVTIVEFADFQCPYCSRMEPILRQILDHYPRDVRLVYRQLPLSEIHPNALGAATASVCADEQGKFWEMHDAMFADQSALSSDALERTAARLELNKDQFDACMAGPKAVAQVKADAAAGTSAGVDGTPGLFVNGRFFNGAMTYDRLAAIIDDELSRQRKVASIR